MKRKRKSSKSKSAKRPAGKKSAWSKAKKVLSNMFSGWDDKPARPSTPKKAGKRSKKVRFKLNARTKRRRKVALRLKSA